MVRLRVIAFSAALCLFELLPRAIAHGHGEEAGEAGEEMMMAEGSSTSIAWTSVASATTTGMLPPPPESYFAHPEMGGLMLGHIGLMVIAWIFVLPIGVWQSELGRVIGMAKGTNS